MWRRMLLTMATGLGLTGVYAVYALVIAPAIQVPARAPGPLAVSQTSETQRPLENVRVAAGWLTEQPWAAAAKYLLRTDQMFVYANEWAPNGEQGQIRFRPFAAVWLVTGDDGTEQAVTVSADSALLVFESAFELDSPKPGHVTRGALDGEVRITGPDGLEILGENFFFSEGMQSIWSHSGGGDPVQFRFGRNRGQAQHLTMRLIKSDGPVAKDRPNVVGIENVTLSQNVRMELSLDEAHAEPTPPVHVKCTGRFVYQVETRTATYEDHVVAYRKAGQPLKADQLWCDKLTVQFEPKAAADTAPNPSGPPAARQSGGDFQKMDRNLEFRALKAEGKKNPVYIASEQQELKAWMSQLTYDARLRTLQLNDESGVRVLQKQNKLKVPEIQIVLKDDNTLQEAICRGIGWLESKDETGAVAFAADWMKQMRKSTDPDTQLDVIELEQDARFEQPARETALGADLIRLWFRPAEAAAEKTQEFRLMDQNAAAEPKRLLALRRVAFISPQVEYEGQHMEVVFDDGTLPSAGADTPLSQRPRPPRRSLTSQRKSSSDARQSMHRTAMASVPPEPADSTVFDPASSAASKPPMEVFAEKMRVRILPLTSPSEPPRVAEIWTAGQVRVVQPSETGDQPIVVTGDRLHVQSNSVTEQVVHVYGEPGRPAHLRDEQQQMHIEGQTIHLDRGANLAWVEGAGLLQLPVPSTLDGQALDEPQLLDVWWKDQMDFDGLLATFEGDVRAKLEGGKMQCRTMQVELSEKVSFSGQRNDNVKPEVQSVTCRDGVEFENHRYLEGQLQEIQKAKVFEFRMDHVTQITEAKGPGWMQMWRRGNGKRAGLAVTESVQANRISNEPIAEWEYTRVDFAGDMTGHLGRRRTTFKDRVEVLYGPVERPVDAIDRHKLPKDGGWMKCDTLQVVQTTPNDDGKTVVQLLGAGNTNLEGRGFYATADQISYDEVKGLFVLRSLGNRAADIWQEKFPGAPRNHTAGQQIEFTPAKNQIRIIRSRGGEGAQ